MRIVTEDPPQTFQVDVRKMRQRKYFDISRNILERVALKVARVEPDFKVNYPYALSFFVSIDNIINI